MTSWRPVVGYEGIYEVSDAGVVVGLDRTLRDGRKYRGKVRRACSGAHGYLQVSLYKDGASKPRHVHRIVLEAFVGACPDGMQACHNNGIKTDNRLTNLRWDTPKANCADRSAHGKWVGGNRNPQRGEANHLAKLKTADVVEIKRLLRAGEKRKNISSMFGVSLCAVDKIYQGRTWRHVA